MIRLGSGQTGRIFAGYNHNYGTGARLVSQYKGRPKTSTMLLELENAKI